MPTLRQDRVQFTQLLAALLYQAWRLGWDCAVDEVVRTDAQAKANASAGTGIARSLHCDGLAVDLLLYDRVTGRYRTDCGAYQALGEWWEAQHPRCRWGGRFPTRDGGHFSLTRGGRA